MMAIELACKELAGGENSQSETCTRGICQQMYGQHRRLPALCLSAHTRACCPPRCAASALQWATCCCCTVTSGKR
ncbi:hypothetical protein E2C01_032537 [Portunus trituberculatus]|uniref:Uncharacterized protein n=1 Tax=Portunus trituberculatus TaxID=210409 RepID=A0A5B7F171_PORTR|nr:hypothetical protein [Portunus trituberculatus]